MYKQYNFRINPIDIKAIDSLGGCRSEHIRNAIQNYLHNGIQNNSNNLAQDFIAELKKDKEILQKRIDYLILPWYQRLLLKRKN